MKTGRRMQPTQTFLRVVLACAAMAMGLGTARADDATLKLDDLGHGTYRIEGHFKITGTPYDVWKVLTDYEHISNYVSSMRKSMVKDSSTDRILLEQEAMGKEFVFTKRIQVMLQVTEIPYKKILFEDVSHHDFAFYEGSWEIHSLPSQELDVVYRLNCQRLFIVPNALAKDALKKGAQSLLAEVRAEVLRRKEGGSPK